MCRPARRAESVTVISTWAARGQQGHPSNPNPLDLVEVELVTGAVVDAGRLRRFVVGDGLDMLDGPAAFAVGGDGLRAPTGRIFFANSSRVHHRILSPARLPSV